MRLYSTQWVVVDFNVLKKINSSGNKSLDKLMIIVEEIPTVIKVADLTKLLLKVSTIIRQYSYFGSFNLPYFKDTQEKSGMRNFHNTRLFSEDYNPRFQIMGHFQREIKNIKDFKHLMQYNGYKLKQTGFINDPSYEDPSIMS